MLVIAACKCIIILIEMSDEMEKRDYKISAPMSRMEMVSYYGTDNGVKSFATRNFYEPIEIFRQVGFGGFQSAFIKKNKKWRE